MELMDPEISGMHAFSCALRVDLAALVQKQSYMKMVQNIWYFFSGELHNKSSMLNIEWWQRIVVYDFPLKYTQTYDAQSEWKRERQEEN